MQKRSVHTDRHSMAIIPNDALQLPTKQRTRRSGLIRIDCMQFPIAKWFSVHVYCLYYYICLHVWVSTMHVSEHNVHGKRTDKINVRVWNVDRRIDQPTNRIANASIVLVWRSANSCIHVFFSTLIPFLSLEQARLLLSLCWVQL